MQVRRIAGIVVLAVSLIAASCSDDSSGTTGEPTTTAGTTAGAGSGSIDAHGGTGQIWLMDEPNVEMELLGPDGEVVATQKLSDGGEVALPETRPTDDEGALVYRYLEPGEGYVVRRADDPSVASGPITVTGPEDHPDPSFYEEQEIGDGYGYLTTRDGTQLAINVILPGPIEDGPYPTVIEYSGYDPANPEPSLVTISKTLAGGQGFATVGVNIRGTGCSGGSFQLWETPQAIDGYDVVETIAAQDWVLGHRVGMVGISYPATAMLYTAATRPPSLAAIAPMASYDDGFRALLWPGGIQNKGFARSWIQGRHDEAEPGGQEWTQKRMDEGDQTCIENQRMRGQNVDLASPIDVLPFYPEINDLGDSFAPATFVDRIEVPTYLVAAWQDEQVGGHAPVMIPNFTGVEHGYFTLVNGYHTEGLANPSVLQRWLEFLQLYVAQQAPDTTGITSTWPIVAGQITGDLESLSSVQQLPERFAGMTHEQALAAYEAQPRVRVLFDEGGAPGTEPGVPVAGFEESFDSYPPADQAPGRLYLGPDGTLTAEAPTLADDDPDAVDAYTSDPTSRPEENLVDGQDTWWRLPEYDWVSPVEGTALSYLTPPFSADAAFIGSASADLWVRSSDADTDLQVTLTEVRPDGKETYIHSGWLRASKRALDQDASTEIQPVQTQLESDAEPMPDGEFVPVRVEVHPFAHMVRAGSRLRVIISAPGADRPVWSFVTLEGTQDNEIARSQGMPSAIVLPYVPGIEAPTPLPPCPGLRGQPCRTYEPIAG